jgi:hypothetical protein
MAFYADWMLTWQMENCGLAKEIAKNIAILFLMRK